MSRDLPVVGVRVCLHGLQLCHRTHTFASDVYMLGTVLFELFVGPPWKDVPLMQVAVQKSAGRSLVDFLPPLLPVELRDLMTQVCQSTKCHVILFVAAAAAAAAAAVPFCVCVMC